MFDANEKILCVTAPDELVEFNLNRHAIPILRILDQEHHEKGDDRRTGIDYELPRIRIGKKLVPSAPKWQRPRRRTQKLVDGRNE
jgi:hypothetical protein